MVPNGGVFAVEKRRKILDSKNCLIGRFGNFFERERDGEWLKCTHTQCTIFRKYKIVNKRNSMWEKTGHLNRSLSTVGW